MNNQFNSQVLLQRIREGDQTAFAQIVYHLSPDLTIKAFKFTKSKVDAEDLVQDIFTDLWEKRHQLINIESFSSYMYVCLKHKFLRKVMRSNLETKALDYLGKRLSQIQSTVLELMEASEVQATISQVVNSLPPHMQQIFYLRGEDHSIREIAQALGLAEQTVKTYNMQLKRRVKEAILTRHPELSHSLNLAILAALSLS
ncbi:RNA polymerase sigma factor [Pedobacter frigoris]|uniref:Sigma-70 family RNA polymerase sigma factor n=1 Tax=Pedobacter frigoris TaxID=2571272 RepID=A0A4U1CG08_9SPHI|nr:sigma-70 family RNA polymerase sigma factor [Pedobacter frigoris]TKC06068.1 sigma-70 family RNA polymerase sigma factor [Pedobacter frigoris]